MTAPPKQPKGKILIVDDEFAILETLVELLSWEGYETVAASDGEAAMVALEQSAPDLVLLDYMMPIMDGLGVLRRMRADPRWQATPVVLMSASRPFVDDVAWSAVLAKPFESARLLTTVRQFIG